jgi:hypothetical protein
MKLFKTVLKTLNVNSNAQKTLKEGTNVWASVADA